MVSIMIGPAKVRKLLPESGFPGIDSSRADTSMRISEAYTKITHHPCHFTGVHHQPNGFALNQYPFGLSLI